MSYKSRNFRISKTLSHILSKTLSHVISKTISHVKMLYLQDNVIEKIMQTPPTPTPGIKEGYCVILFCVLCHD
jgi:hypothetical protein